MEKYILEYRRRGGQVRAYGPCEHDFTVTIESDHKFELRDEIFDAFAKRNHPWQHENIDKGAKTFWDWTLVKRERTGNSVRYILQKAYDD